MKTQADRIRELSPDKQALLKELLEHRSAAAPAIRKLDRNGQLRLSFAQERAWLFHQLEPHNPAHNVSAAVRMQGSCDPELLQESIRAVIARHESLRTTFGSEDGRPVQRMVPPSNIDWTLERVDLSALPKPARQAEVQRLAMKQAERPFDLSQLPLFRASLLTLARQQHVLLLTLHHIICDGWSLRVLKHEVAQNYHAQLTGVASDLQPLEFQYADFAAWQRTWLDAGRAEQQFAFWKKALGDHPAALDLPTDRPRPPVQTFQGNCLRRQVSGDVLCALQGLAREQRATLFMVLLAAWQTILARYSGQDDICVGSPIANRMDSQWEKAIGFFANTLVLRTNLAGDPSFRELVERVKEVTLDAYSNQDIPFEKIVERLGVPREPSRTPLFQVMFVMQNIPVSAREVEGLSVVDIELGHQRATEFDLTLNVDQRSDGLDLLLMYNTDLFDSDTAARMLGCYLTLLDGIYREPDTSISRLPILDSHQIQQQIVDWNNTQTDVPRDRCVHDLLVDQAARTPHAISVESLAGSSSAVPTLSYAQLDQRSDQLAAHLATLGVCPDMPVGLCAAHLADQLVGLFGILKAGGAFVPLDPSFPQDRIDFMVDDAELSVIVSHSAQADALPQRAHRLVLLDADGEAICASAFPPDHPQPTPDHLAYIVYTSGSTGRPKGVAVEHGALVNYVLAMADRFGIEPGDRILNYLPISFDAALEEVFPFLARGATLCAHPTPRELLPRELIELSQRDGINYLHLSPQVVNQVFDELAAVDPAGFPLKAILTGGDACSLDKLNRFLTNNQSGIRFLSAYGLSETCITSSLFEPDRPITRCRSVPIGRPIANTVVYVLDRHLQPVPVGVRGEIYIGGIGLARGYHRRPKLNREKFLADPFRTETAARLFRTGDTGRFLPDGTLEFLGRIDDQVKIRSYRVELGEIEAALGTHPAIEQAVVAAPQGHHSTRRLVGYVIPRADMQPTASELREFLLDRLPVHMVPQQFVTLKSLPITAGGKVDRRALPAPAMDPDAERTFVAPRTPIEEALVSIWQAILQVERVSVDENFFELGGDSLLVLQMIAQARKAGIYLAPKQLFLHQTIAELACHAQDADAIDVGHAGCLVPIRTGGPRPPLFCIHPGGGTVFCYLELARHLPEDQPIYGLQAQGIDGVLPPHTAVGEMVEHYVNLIREIQPVGPYQLCGWSSGGIIAYEIARRLEAKGQRLILIDTGIPNPGDELGADDLATVLLAMFPGEDAERIERMRSLSHEEQLEYFREQAQRAGQVVPGLEAAYLHFAYEVFKANANAMLQYRPSKYAGKIILVRGNADSTPLHKDPLLGWGHWAQGGVDVQPIEGDHVGLFESPTVEKLAAIVEAQLLSV